MKQCAKCPWKLGTDTDEIPGGYDPAKHEALRATIAEPGRFSLGPLHLMSCHEYPVGSERACVGWLAHPSGLSREWNDPRAPERLRAALAQLESGEPLP